jgi:integration host factor subunit alpha
VTKQELIKRVASTPGLGPLKKSEVAQIVDAVFNQIAEYFVEAQPPRRVRRPVRFSYPGFGTFLKKRRSPRPVRNPQTGELLVIPETMTLTFSPGQELKALLNTGARKRRTG